MGEGGRAGQAGIASVLCGPDAAPSGAARQDPTALMQVLQRLQGLGCEKDPDGVGFYENTHG